VALHAALDQPRFKAGEILAVARTPGQTLRRFNPGSTQGLQLYCIVWLLGYGASRETVAA
jgi:hypothetical protein